MDCEDCVEGPRFITMLNERYFLFQWMNTSGAVIGHGVYDIQALREYPIDLGSFYFTKRQGDTLFWESYYDQSGIYYGQLSLYAANITSLPNLEPVNLLAGIAHEPVQIPQAPMGERLFQMSLLTEDKRYYIVACNAGLTIFDLRQRGAFRLHKNELGVDAVGNNIFLRNIFLRDDNTLIWLPYGVNIIELTLP